MSLTMGMIAATAVGLSACTKSPPPPLSGPPGEISLRFNGATDADIHFVLENRSKQGVLFKATQYRLRDPEPWESSLYCSYGHGGGVLTHFPPLDYDFHPVTVFVQPEQRVDLVYPRAVLDIDLSGECELEIDLGASRVKSKFTLGKGGEAESDDTNVGRSRPCSASTSCCECQ